MITPRVILTSRWIRGLSLFTRKYNTQLGYKEVQRSIQHRKGEEKRILSMIYEGNPIEAVEEWRKTNSGLPPEKSPSFGIKLCSHLIASGKVEDGFTLLSAIVKGQLTDDQFAASLERILDSEMVKNPIELGEKFYTQVVSSGFHRKRNRDALISKILQAKINDTEKVTIDQLFDLYSRLSKIEPELTEKEEQNRQKIHPECLWTIIKWANEVMPKKKANEKLKKVFKFVEENGSIVQADCFQGLWLLYQGKVLEFADSLFIRNSMFSGNHIEYLMVIAEHTKEPKILEGLLDYPEFFKKIEMLNKVCESIALICGKTQDFNGLERLLGRILRLYKSDPEQYHVNLFKKVLYRMTHFYKCNNSVPPEPLAEVIKRLR